MMAKKKERWISLPHASRVTRIPMQRLDRILKRQGVNPKEEVRGQRTFFLYPETKVLEAVKKEAK